MPQSEQDEEDQPDRRGQPLVSRRSPSAGNGSPVASRRLAQSGTRVSVTRNGVSCELGKHLEQRRQVSPLVAQRLRHGEQLIGGRG
jgi:hypothetical protein